jgi:putative transposase
MTCPLKPHTGTYDFTDAERESMTKSNHTEAQMIGALKQLEAGRNAGWECRSTRSTPGRRSTAAWRLSQAQEAEQLRDERTRLRKLVADLSLDKDALQWVIEKNGWSSRS